jgi:hypothetical protein
VEIITVVDELPKSRGSKRKVAALTANRGKTDSEDSSSSSAEGESLDFKNSDRLANPFLDYLWLLDGDLGLTASALHLAL